MYRICQSGRTAGQVRRSLCVCLLDWHCHQARCHWQAVWALPHTAPLLSNQWSSHRFESLLISMRIAVIIIIKRHVLVGTRS